MNAGAGGNGAYGIGAPTSGSDASYHPSDFGQGGSAAPGVLFAEARVDQAQEQGPCQTSMLPSRQGGIGRFCMLCQGPFDSTYLVISCHCQSLSVAVLEQLIEGKLQQRQGSHLPLGLEEQVAYQY